MHVRRWINANWGVLALIIVVGQSLALNVYLFSRLGSISATPAAASVVDPTGTGIDAVAAVDKDGQDTIVDFRSPNGTIVYYWSISCVWCDRNHANIVALAEGEHGRRVVGVTSGTRPAVLKAYLQAQPLPFETFVVDDPVWLGAAAFTATPATLLLGARPSNRP